MNITILLIVPVVLPVLVGLLFGFWPKLKYHNRQRLILRLVLLVNALIVLRIVLQPNSTHVLFSLNEHLTLFLEDDTLGSFFALFASVMFFVVGVYEPAYMEHEGHEGRLYMFYLMVLGMLVGLGFSGNFITMYFFFELMTILCMPLILHSMKPEAITAAFKFLYYSIAGASLALIGFFFLSHFGISMDFVAGGTLDPHRLIGSEPVMLFVTLLTIIGFGAKGGMFPLHAWLPSAHPVAPAPAHSLLSGVIAKAGAFCVIRFIFYIVGADFIRGTWVQMAWIALSLIGIMIGSTLALREPGIKRRLAFSSVSQLNYVMLGLAMLTSGGFTAGMLHIVFHGIAKSGLFLIAGAIIMMTGRTEVAQLRGIGRHMPLMLTCFSILSLAVIGIPPTSGFVSKWALAMAALHADIGFFAWLIPIVLLISALLTAGYLLPIAVDAFFPGHRFEHDDSDFADYDPPLTMTIPVIVLTVAAVLFGLFPDRLISLFATLAGSVL